MQLNKSFIFIIILFSLFSTIVFAKTDNFNIGPDLRQEVYELKVKVSALENRLYTLEQQSQPRLLPLNKD
jgi:hypothetical protein